MRHDFKLLPPRSGPLVTTTVLGAAARHETGWRLSCTMCGEDLTAPYDVLDSDRIASWAVKQKKRDDCPGKTGRA